MIGWNMKFENKHPVSKEVIDKVSKKYNSRSKYYFQEKHYVFKEVIQKISKNYSK